jgi:hypothetical protein
VNETKGKDVKLIESLLHWVWRENSLHEDENGDSDYSVEQEPTEIPIQNRGKARVIRGKLFEHEILLWLGLRLIEADQTRTGSEAANPVLIAIESYFKTIL